ncbi:phosphopantetheine-binding protein [Streptomyces sp. NPDC087908]|uniref:phosphopantetheine-binding protein n=1 Tax=Streptomyces sp. NPDC087908 TaxID=3365820 RepID=UPI00380737A1
MEVTNMTTPVVSSETDATLRPLIRRAWAEVLSHNEFGDEDYFFSVGGTSLAAIRLMRLVGLEVGHKLPIRLLFNHQTVALLDEAVRRTLANET